MSETPAPAAPNRRIARRIARRAEQGIAFSPPLLALAPILLVYAPNAGLLPDASLVRPLVVALLTSLALWTLAAALLRGWTRGAAFATVLMAALYLYGIVAPRSGLDPGPLRQALSVAVAMLLGVLAAWRFRDPRPLNLFASLLLLFASFGAGRAFLSHRGTESGHAAEGGDAGSATAARPDVYYIILDGFGREDALKAKLGFNDAFFTDGLRRLGFFVADRSRANYVQTELSLASSLNMEPLTTLLPNLSRETEDRSPFDRLIAENAVAKTFEARGYRFLTVTTGFPAIRFPAANSGYTPTGGLSLLESAVLNLTPFGERSEFAGSQFIARRDWLRRAFDSLDALAGDSGQPKFVFAHILAPHPPFVFDAKGAPVQYEKTFGYYDGSDWVGTNGSAARYAEGYAGQATWTAERTLATVRRILAAYRTPPVIIVQGDHGPKSRLAQNSLRGTDLDEVVPNLNAYFVPDPVRMRLDPGVTPVNSFRILLSALFGLDLPRRPDRSYYSPFAKPMELTDVTDRVR